jgi:hypothetical protein
MSMYYSPQIVRLLMEERLREAQEARRLSPRRTTARPSRFAGLADRLFAGRTSSAPTTCSC